MNILAIDPGTHCGWAVFKNGTPVACGEWDLKGNRFEGGGMRLVRLRGYIKEIILPEDIEHVAYEEVRGHRGTDAAHWYGAITGAIQLVCEDLRIPYKGYPVAAVKKFATGKGNASKDDVWSMAVQRWGPPLAVNTNNMADALWIGALASKELGDTK